MRILLLVFLSAFLYAQDYKNQGENPVNWGESIRLGTTFTSTDSTRLFALNLHDTLFSSATDVAKDTLFSDWLPIRGDDFVGIYNIVAYAEGLGNATQTLDSIRIDVRFGEDFIYYSTGVQHKIVWDYNTSTNSGWYNVMDIATGIKEEAYISQADSTWWNPAAFRQYRVVVEDADIDTVRIWLTDYIR